MATRLLRPLLLLLFLAGCFPDMDSPKVRTAMLDVRRRMATDQFDRTIGHIEVHRLRHGHYPASLDELDTVHDLMMGDMHTLAYTRLDTGYQLNLVGEDFPQFSKRKDTLIFSLPERYWQGLGCRALQPDAAQVNRNT